MEPFPFIGSICTIKNRIGDLFSGPVFYVTARILRNAFCTINSIQCAKGQNEVSSVSVVSASSLLFSSGTSCPDSASSFQFGKIAVDEENNAENKCDSQQQRDQEQDVQID